MAWTRLDVPRAATRCVAFAMALALPACAPGRPEADIGVTRLSPAQSRVCVEAVLAGHPLETTPQPFASGWRLDLHVLSGAPRGRLDKGAVLHDGRTLAYLPEGATEGLADDVIATALSVALEACR